MGTPKRKYVTAGSGDRVSIQGGGMEEVPQGERAEEMWMAGPRR